MNSRFVVGDIVVFKTLSNTMVARMVNETDVAFQVEKPYYLFEMTDEQMNPELRAKVAQSPNLRPVGFAPLEPFFDGPVTIYKSQTLLVGAPRDGIKNLYIRNTSGIILSKPEDGL